MSRLSMKRIVLQLRTVVMALARDVADGQINLHAMSLVYTTLLSLVPLLALSFSVLKGFGVQNQLEPTLIILFASLGDKAVEVAQQLIGFVSNVKVGVLGAVGLGILLFTVSSLIGKIVNAINFTWSLIGRRNLAQRLPDYLAMLLVAPLLLFSLAGAATGALQTEWVKSLLEVPVIDALYRHALLWLPLFLNAFALMFIYWFFPAIKVRWYAALTGGLIAAGLWKLIGFVFSIFVVNSGNYTAIYSAFATILLFMIWLYLSWLTLLLGSRIAYYTQFPGAAAVVDQDVTPQNIEFAGLQIVQTIVQRFRQEGGAVSLAELKAGGRYTEGMILPILKRLEAESYLQALEGHERAYLLARDPHLIPMAQIFAIIRGGTFKQNSTAAEKSKVDQQLETLLQSAFGDMTLAQWSMVQTSSSESA